MTRRHQHTLDEYGAGADRQQSIHAAADTLADAAATQATDGPTPAAVAFDAPAVVERQPHALTFVDETRRAGRPAPIDLTGPPAVQVPTQCAAIAATTGTQCENERMHDSDLCASHRRASEVTRWYER